MTKKLSKKEIIESLLEELDNAEQEVEEILGELWELGVDNPYEYKLKIKPKI